MYLAAIYPHDDGLHLNIHIVIDLHNVNVDHTIVAAVKIPLHISIVVFLFWKRKIINHNEQRTITINS